MMNTPRRYVLPFIKIPEKGNIVKVYNTEGRKAIFGKVVRLGIRRRYPTDDFGALYRQIVILKRCRPVNIWQCDFFFSPDRVRFLPANNKTKRLSALRQKS